MRFASISFFKGYTHTLLVYINYKKMETRQIITPIYIENIYNFRTRKNEITRALAWLKRALQRSQCAEPAWSQNEPKQNNYTF